jgi:hypothetical protein
LKTEGVFADFATAEFTEVHKECVERQLVFRLCRCRY